MSQGVARVVADRYRLVRQLGRGGMGVVWHAHDGLLGREVAVKEIYVPGAGADPADPADPLAARALREARAAAQLRHPGIITVHDVVVDDGRPWIVMELIDGRSLGQVIGDEGVLSEQRTAAIGLRVLAALQAAHQHGILHRDVKPPNILLDGDRVVLTDFGIAAIDGATALTATGQMVGSPAYLAPERINGRPATAATDLWALGVTLYAAVTGRSPFQRDDTLSTFAAVLTSRPAPPAGAGQLWPAIHGLLAKDPARRLTADRAAVLLAAVTYPATVPVRQTALRWPRWRPADAPPPAGPATPVMAAPAVPETATNIRAAPAPPAGPVPTQPEAGPPPVGGLAAVRRRRRAVRSIGILAAAALLAAASLTGEPAARRNDGRTQGEAAHPGGRPSSTAAVTPGVTATPSATLAASPASTPPPPPPGFKTVSFSDTYFFAVPQEWVLSPNNWENHADIQAGPIMSLRVEKSKLSKGESAVAFLRGVLRYLLSDGYSHHYRQIRLTSVATPRGASSAAAWEFTDWIPSYSESLHEHTIERTVAFSTGEIYVFSVSLVTDSGAALTREWATAKPILTKVLNSGWRSPG